MHVLYVHQNFPAQFGHIAAHLARKPNWKCTFVSETPGGQCRRGVEKIQYKAQPAEQDHGRIHFGSRTFEKHRVWGMDGVYKALKARGDVKPDLIIGHSGFGSTLFLRELYPDVPVINFFEYYYHPHGPESDMDFRRDLQWKMTEEKYHRARCRNAMILLDLQNCDAAYAPTEFQKSRFPAEYQPKIQVIFDGVDRNVYHGHEETLRPPVKSREARTIAGVPVPPGTRIVTYVSRGFESMRGFDIFIRSAKRIAELYPDVIFIVVGTDRIAYGGDEGYIEGAKTFKEWVLAKEKIDASKFAFVGRIKPTDLAILLASTDLKHLSYVFRFVLSWSMMDAMSCGAVVLASGTSPVKEMIREGENGLLVDFFDVEGMAQKAAKILADPDSYRPLGRAAEQMIRERYSLEASLPQMLKLYEQTAAGGKFKI